MISVIASTVRSLARVIVVHLFITHINAEQCKPARTANARPLCICIITNAPRVWVAHAARGAFRFRCDTPLSIHTRNRCRSTFDIKWALRAVPDDDVRQHNNWPHNRSAAIEMSARGILCVCVLCRVSCARHRYWYSSVCCECHCSAKRQMRREAHYSLVAVGHTHSARV